MSKPEEKSAPTTSQAGEQSLLDQMVEQGRFGRGDAAKERGRDLIRGFIAQLLEGSLTVSEDTEAMINARIAQIDHLVSIQLNEILHQPEFQKLEGSWRGLKYLLDQSETGTQLRIRVLNVSKKELLRDLQKAVEFDQSSMFKKIYEEGYGVFGGEPFSALIGDYEFGRHPEDMELLQKMAGVAASAHAPLLSAAAPELLNLESFSDLSAPRDLAKIFDNSEFTKWKSFRESEDSRYVALTMPHVLMRLPYGRDTASIEAFNYEEGVDGSDHSKYLWGNAAYALGARMTNAHALYGWCVAIRGVENGGQVLGLPAHTFRTEDGDVALKCPTEIAITERREKELADHGLVGLVHRKGSDNATFFSVQSCNKPKRYDKDSANANARLSAQIPYIMATSRFAHYLKAMMREKIGSPMTRTECQQFLNSWISQYVVSNPDAVGADIKAQYPLSAASVEVEDVPGRPGAYRAVAYLKPHFQLEELGVSMRLVAELPTRA
jgi:type VI secretion system protein ImpC